jgi:hypothetical protein
MWSFMSDQERKSLRIPPLTFKKMDLWEVRLLSFKEETETETEPFSVVYTNASPGPRFALRVTIIALAFKAPLLIISDVFKTGKDSELYDWY